ncbi:MAG: hypothetical protein PGN11_04500 [Quadrisphaera sp.]
MDNRLMALQLVNLGLSGVAMFSADREVLQPSEALRKRPVLVERGSFRPPTNVNIDMLECAKREFAKDPDVAGKQVLVLTELTMSNLLAGGSKVDRRDFLARADLLSATGSTVLISNFADYHRLAAYLQARTSERIGMVMGVPSLEALFREETHAHLPGGLLESWGRLLKNELKLFVYPKKDIETGEVVTVEDMEVGEELQPLFDYLSGRGSFVHLADYNPEYLSILSRDVLKRIAAHDETWQDMVPTEVAELICKRSFFGYKRDAV